MDDFWAYPLRRGDTLSSHDWTEWHYHRMLGSRLVSLALKAGRREDIATAMLLWGEAMRQDPAGTLPDDDVELARLAGFATDLEAWRAARPLALHGWSVTEVEGYGAGEPPRLGHLKLLAGIAARTFRRKSGREQARENGGFAVRKSRVKAHLEAISARAGRDDRLVLALTRHIEEAGLRITRHNVQEAWTRLSMAPSVVPIRGGDG